MATGRPGPGIQRKQFLNKEHQCVIFYSNCTISGHNGASQPVLPRLPSVYLQEKNLSFKTCNDRMLRMEDT